VVTVSVPWAEPGSGFTALFEALVINWLKAASISAVSDRLRLSWNAVDGIMQRAVKRGLSRREALSPKHISVDETSYRKGHDYVTVVTDQLQSAVLHVAENRDTESLSEFYTVLSAEQKDGIESVCMDMWPAYIKATRMHSRMRTARLPLIVSTSRNIWARRWIKCVVRSTANWSSRAMSA